MNNSLYSVLAQVQDQPTQTALRIIADALSQMALVVGGSRPGAPTPATPLREAKLQLQAGGNTPLVLTGLPITSLSITVGPFTLSFITANGPLKISGGVVSEGAIILTSDVSGILPVANGGTAASSAAAARASLGVPAAGVFGSPGTYVTGLKLTGGGNDGSITVNGDGQITAVTPAT